MRHFSDVGVAAFRTLLEPPTLARMNKDIEFYGHSGVRLGDIAIDPGAFTSNKILDGAKAVIVTHIHGDHINPDLFSDAILRSGVEIFGPSQLQNVLGDRGIPFTSLKPGETVTIAGQEVTIFGGKHWPIYDTVPVVDNLSLLVGDVVHPGDDFPVELPTNISKVDTLLLPVSAPWVKLSDAIDFAHRISAANTHPIHDAILNKQGKTVVDNVCTKTKVPGYLRREAIA